MQPRIEAKKGERVIMQVLCDPATSDGDLVVILEDALMDLRWDVMQHTETQYQRRQAEPPSPAKEKQHADNRN